MIKLKPGESIQTRGVLAGSYVRDPSKGHKTHSVVCGADDFELVVLCRRVKLENIGDIFGQSAAALRAKPTCLQCLARDPRFVVAKKRK